MLSHWTQVVFAPRDQGLETVNPIGQVEHFSQYASAVYVHCTANETPLTHCGGVQRMHVTGLLNTSNPNAGSAKKPGLHNSPHELGPLASPDEMYLEFATVLVHGKQ